MANLIHDDTEKLKELSEELTRIVNDNPKDTRLADRIALNNMTTVYKPHMLPDDLEDDSSARTCQRCGKVISLMHTVNEHGMERRYNRMPSNLGLCSCGLSLQVWPEAS